MYSYLARQSIVDTAQRLYGYELLFRDGEKNCFPNIDPDEATSKLLTESHLTIGFEEITGGNQAFINFHQDTLLNRFPTSLDPKRVVIEIVETVDVTESLLETCNELRVRGYKFALDDYDFDIKWDVLLPLVQFIKVDISEFDAKTIEQNIPKLKKLKAKLIAERVETKEEFSRFKDMGFDYFQGYFFTKPEILKSKNISSSKMTLLELISASSEAELNFAKISHILEKDVALSYKLLRFINNPAMNKNTKIQSLKHALNYMGEVEVKKFLALMALANLADGNPDELAVISLVRAKFCDLVSSLKRDAQNPPSGFLVGLFSLLDTLLGKDMDSLIAKLPLEEVLASALCGKDNTLKTYLNLACAFEHGDWDKITVLSNMLAIESDTLFDLYGEAVLWSSSVMTMITQPEAT